MSVSQASANTYRPPTIEPFVSLALAFLAAVNGLLADARAFVAGERSFAHAAVPRTTHAHVEGPVMVIGRALLVAVIILIVLGELYATDIVANPTNPNTFTNLTSTFASYGETAYIMVGLGLIALGASVALSYFGGFTNNGGR